MNRRTLLTSAAPVIALSGLIVGCSVLTETTTNGVTTITINVAKVNQYAEAFASGVATVLGVPGVALMLGVYLAPFQAIAGTIVQDIAAFNTASGGQSVLTFDATSVPAAVNSILADGQKILNTIANALPQTTIVGTLLSAIDAVQTIVLLFEAMLPATVGATFAAVPRIGPMTEVDALAVLGVR